MKQLENRQREGRGGVITDVDDDERVSATVGSVAVRVGDLQACVKVTTIIECAGGWGPDAVEAFAHRDAWGYGYLVQDLQHAAMKAGDHAAERFIGLHLMGQT